MLWFLSLICSIFLNDSPYSHFGIQQNPMKSLSPDFNLLRVVNRIRSLFRNILYSSSNDIEFSTAFGCWEISCTCLRKPLSSIVVLLSTAVTSSIFLTKSFIFLQISWTSFQPGMSNLLPINESQIFNSLSLT